MDIHFAAIPASTIFSEMDHASNATTYIAACRFLHAHALCPGLLAGITRLSATVTIAIKDQCPAHHQKLNIQSLRKKWKSSFHKSLLKEEFAGCPQQNCMRRHPDPTGF